MKKGIVILSSFLMGLNLYSQTNAEASIIIVSCKSGTLLIDGNVIGQIEADDANKQTLSYGEHYLQLKTATEKINLTINVDKNTKGITKIGCSENELKSQGVRIIDKEVSLSGALGSDLEKNVVGLDKDDEIVLSCSVLNKKGKITISLTEYNSGREIYKKEGINEIENEKIKIPTKGVYYFLLYTEALFGKNAKLIVDRIPSPNSSPSFSTTVKTIFDTTFVEVLNTVTRVYSTTNFDHPSRTTIKINLPANTTYWAYWIGVGQEAQAKMKNFTSSLSSVGKLLSTNPLIQFGMRIIPSLPMLNSTSTISYRFTDTKNGQLFANGLTYSYYTFKHAQNISTDYSLVKENFSDLVLGMNNESTLTGQDVDVRVVAFTVTPKWILQE